VNGDLIFKKNQSIETLSTAILLKILLKLDPIEKTGSGKSLSQNLKTSPTLSRFLIRLNRTTRVFVVNIVWDI